MFHCKHTHTLANRCVNVHTYNSQRQSSGSRMDHCEHCTVNVAQVSLWNFCPDRSVPVNCKSYYCEMEAFGNNKTTQWTSKKRLSPVASLTTEWFQTASGSTKNFTKWVSMAEHHTPKITMCNAKRQREWFKTLGHWNLKQCKHALWSDES